MMDTKQQLAGLTGTAWGGAIVLAALRATDTLPQKFTPFLIVFVGLAVWGGMALSRIRLTETITAVFTAGIHAAEMRQRERTERAVQRVNNNPSDGATRPSARNPGDVEL